MKKLKKKVIEWLLRQLQEPIVVTNEIIKQQDFTKEQISRANFTKSIFQTYFDGCYMTEPHIENLPTSRLGITNIEFEFKGDLLIMKITLLRPGLLIGKAGKTINDLTEYLNHDDKPIEIQIIESKLWSRIV